ncbi:DUF1490 domain-containing protein, partial [Dysosmobacter welbionis]
DGLALLHQDLRHRAGHPGGDGGLHLHSLDGDQGLVLLHGVAHLDVEPAHRAGDRGAHLALVLRVRHGDLDNVLLGLLVGHLHIPADAV